jgi:hypothetical protein
MKSGRAMRAMAMGAWVFGLEAAAVSLLACGNGSKDSGSASSTKNYYGGTGTSSLSSSSTSTTFMVPMNFIDGAVIVTYPDASPDAEADGSVPSDGSAPSDASLPPDAAVDAAEGGGPLNEDAAAAADSSASD